MKRRKDTIIPPSVDTEVPPSAGADAASPPAAEAPPEPDIDAQLAAWRALDVDTTPPAAPVPEALVDRDFVPPPGYAPASIPNDTLVSSSGLFELRIVSVPHGSFYHPNGILWPFQPDAKGLRVAQEAWLAMHTPSELTADTLWSDLVLPYLDEEVRTKGPFPSLGSVRETAKNFFKAEKLPVPHNRTIEKRLRKHRPEWIRPEWMRKA